jgi:drug/metabolite transporter (DMT)-like permease
MIPAINAALIHKTLVLFVAILALFFLKEKMSRTMVVAVIVLFLSNFIIGGFRGLTYSAGEIMVLVATIIWAVETILAKKALRTIDPDILTSARMGFGSLVLVGASLITSPNEFSSIFSLNATQTFWILATMFTLLLYVTSWYRALQYAPATSVAAVVVGSTVVTNLLSALFITRVLNITVLAQSAVIILCVWLVYTSTLEINKAKSIKTTS